jgi:membrane glycosyltransferase
MELPPAARLDAEADRACRRYLDQLALPVDHAGALLELAQRESEAEGALGSLHDGLAGAPGAGQPTAFASVRRRFQLAAPEAAARAEAHDGVWSLPIAPPIRRTPMAPTDWPATILRRVLRRGRGPRSAPATATGTSAIADSGKATRAATLRRTVFLVLALAQTAAFAYFMTTNVLPYHGQQPLEVAILMLFTILFAWISLGFWTALSGFLLLCFGGDRHAITRAAAPTAPIPPDARTAIVMPIRNEHVARVFAGVRATWESVAATGLRDRFDFFILSDSNEPDTLVAERQAWLDLCTAADGFGRIFYRWRRHHIKRKSGNIADFCRRWGSQYRYMVVLDADSVMSGECLTTLVRLMEASPTAGLIQTAPRAAGRDTLYARTQQFATRVYGPLFTAGLHFWQLGESYYWGHNAIIRIAPFMRHCALGRLPGRGSLSGEIMSHDFVEAALMRRAGWKVWMAYDLPGSYEEVPPNVIDELKRDRRWCQGNLINSRLFLWQGLNPAHRAVFMTGVMAYVSAPLWFLSLVVSTAFIVLQTVIGPQYFVQPRQLFPIWPKWDVDAAVGFLMGTAVVLFTPKILGGLVALAHGARHFGGLLGATLSVLLEILFSAMLAPIRMLFHTQFVLAALTGLGVHWKSPPREDAETTWGEAVRRHGVHTLIGGGWLAGVYWLESAYASWLLLPVVAPLALSIPISVYSSRVSLGRLLRRARLLRIPEESDPPDELRRARLHASQADVAPGFVDAVVHPRVNAMACALSGPRVKGSPRAESRRSRAVAAALKEGPRALTDADKVFLLTDCLALSQLHFQVWTSPAVHPEWLAATAPITPIPTRSSDTAGEPLRAAG